MSKVGIFGGTFNPIHWGHLLAAETALEQVRLDRILWVPTSHSPYKTTVQPVSFHHRYQMVQRAIDSHPRFCLPPFEQIAAPAASAYAIDMLKALQHHYGACEWHWILGLDAFHSLPRWVGRRELIPQCLWLVAPRSNTRSVQHSCAPTGTVSANALEQLESCCDRVADQLWTEAIEVRWQLLQMPMVQVSSSLVRQHCQQQRSIRYLVPEAVRDYIATHHLYEV